MTMNNSILLMNSDCDDFKPRFASRIYRAWPVGFSPYVYAIRQIGCAEKKTVKPEIRDQWSLGVSCLK